MEMSIENGQIFHMLECGERNEKHEQHESTRPVENCLKRWADPGFRDWLFGYNVIKEVEEMREGYEARLNHSRIES